MKEKGHVGRPKMDREVKKSNVSAVRLSDEELQVLQVLAEGYGFNSISKVIRYLIFNVALKDEK